MAKKQKKKKRVVLKVMLCLLLIMGAIIIDSCCRLTVSEFDLSYGNLPESFDGFRIVQLSDLHSAQFGKDNERLLSAVRKQKPDIIVLTGDFINRSGENKNQAEKLRTFFENLSQIAPCYFVSGNHEWASNELPQLADVLEQSGIMYLRNEFVPLEKGGDTIILAGVDDRNGWADMTRPNELISEIRQEYPESFIAFLGHRDDWLKKYPDLDVDIVFSGHAHGGVVRLPFVGGVFSTEYDLFPEYDAGVYNEGTYDLVLSRGLGNFNIIPRFLNPPEIITCTLHS